ncbi:NADP-dependent oxidoreductase [Parachlamydia acanthamoebae]|uniref:NADP-dependent oxidoreductase n=1 Tax=Parachlamydia acanthamoebae TaxID=83552 RepID=UPI0024E22A27|nr:NADP-dependent oxidoreductase [Parachlamydia acanthamoebae]
MKAIIVERFGGAERLKFGEFPKPQLQEHEILVEIQCTSVNPVDWKIREGLLSKVFPTRFPYIPGWDASGIVVECGAKTKKFKKGDRIFSYCRKSEVHEGTYAEYISIEEKHVALMPSSLSFAEAAAIPLVGLTAWQSLFDIGNLKANQTILIVGGSGGVGSMAIQFAKHAGATVYTTASQVHHAYVKKLGAEKVIDYQKDNVQEKIKEWEPEGVDVILDLVGGHALQECYPLVKKHGRLISIVEKPAVFQHIHTDYAFGTPSGQELQKIATLIDQGKIVPPKISILSLEKAAEAQEEVKAGHTEGKIVLAVKNQP